MWTLSAFEIHTHRKSELDLPSLSLLVDNLLCLLLSSFVSLSLSQTRGMSSHCDTEHKFSLSHKNWAQVSVQIEYRAQVSVSFTHKSGHKFSSGTQVVSWWYKTQVFDISRIHRKSGHKLSSGKLAVIKFKPQGSGKSVIHACESYTVLHLN